jgi:hypothetical protein
VFEKIRIKATPGYMKELTVFWAVISHLKKINENFGYIE